ncbi:MULTISPECIES: hypothetical protein [Hydrogenophaga]|uniref:Uncharacterized protein n=1 Tax=Hydrogenophaga electricum TaxID=1230953 RepID=A0ABQ6C552_9BURK|nr:MULTISPECIES: hypothetical protein [Hydrogenophaga]GLS15418.1 hypothetical protein GCM10007935_28540 [Hydrogenophaga electricum]
MFEPGFDQAAGLRTRRPGSPVVMPVASPAQPARAYELLCQLSLQLAAAGRHPVVLDGSAAESLQRRSGPDGSHLGLLHLLQDPSIANLERPTGGGEWLVLPAARGLERLQETARAGGSRPALTRLLAPFGDGAALLLLAPAATLATLFRDLEARVLVPVLGLAQSSIDAYGALKLLRSQGLAPVLAPLPDEGAPDVLHKVLDTVTDCARRHLDYDAEVWPAAAWGTRVQECALGRPRDLRVTPGTPDASAPVFRGWQPGGVAGTQWS